MEPDRLDYFDTVRAVVWGFIKGIVVLLCIAVIMFSCSYFMQEQGGAAWFPKSTGGH